jgi:hypothetical protein
MYDTVLYARRSTCTGTEVACNDNFAGSLCSAPSGRSSSAIEWNSTTWGQGLYYLVVDGAGGMAGNYWVVLNGL